MHANAYSSCCLLYITRSKIHEVPLEVGAIIFESNALCSTIAVAGIAAPGPSKPPFPPARRANAAAAAASRGERPKIGLLVTPATVSYMK